MEIALRINFPILGIPLGINFHCGNKLVNQFPKLEKIISMNFHLWKWPKSLKESLHITVVWSSLAHPLGNTQKVPYRRRCLIGDPFIHCNLVKWEQSKGALQRGCVTGAIPLYMVMFCCYTSQVQLQHPTIATQYYISMCTSKMTICFTIFYKS